MARSPGKREPAPASPASSALSDTAVRWLLALIHVVCPLLFFTNLTRNPYFTQIALLNVGIALCAVIWAVDCFRRGEWRLPRTPADLPLAAFLLAALVSSVVSWVGHPMVRSGLVFEMTRVWVFTLVNSAMVFYLPGLFTKPMGDSSRQLNIWSDIVLALVWGALWFGFHEMKSPDPDRIIWDTYGAFLWGLAGLYAVLRARDGAALAYFHLIFSVCLVAGTYGVLQYWGTDIIWTSPVQPYGGRPVSSFGNPNFLSSYLMMATPLALVFSFRASGAQRWGYALVALVSGLGILSTLTRSTYVGLAAALLVTGVALYRRGEFKLARPALAALGVFIGLVLLFPHTPVSSVQSPLARFTEIFDAMKTGTSYGPWHQRILIWSSAWDMLDGHWFFGRGWGSFELFFPYFQGKFLLVPILAQWRTHANNAHNVLLELWAQTGFVGVGTAIWLFAAMVAGGWAVARRSMGAARLTAAALLGGVAGLATDNFFGNVSIFFAVPAFLFWWNAGALFNESAPPSFRGGRLSDSVGRPLMAVFAALCLASSVYFVARWNQEVWYFRGFKQAKTGDAQGSIKSLEKAVAWFPGEVNTNYELGNSYSQWARSLASRNLNDEAGRADARALNAYGLAIAANPGYDEIHFNAGVTMAQLGRIDDAIAKIELALFINPILKEGYGTLGTLYFRTKAFEKAADLFKRGAQSFPDDKDFWNNQGYALEQLKRHDEAFEAFKQAVIVDPGFSRAWENLAASAAAGGRRDPILQVPALIGAMEKDIQKENFPAALAIARRVVELLPTSADAHLSMGNLLFYAGQPDAAEVELKKAIELKPNFPAAHGNLGRIYAVRNDLVKARLHLERAVALDPSDGDSRRALQELPR